MNIAFLTYDWVSIDLDTPLVPNGCAYYRCVLPGMALHQLGHHVGIGLPAWDDAYGFGLMTSLTTSRHGYDVLVFKLVMSAMVADRIPLAQGMGQRIVVDVDDYFEGLSPDNIATTLTDPARNADSNRDHYLRIIDLADALIVSTPFLRDYYAAKGKTVYMVRNGIDADRYRAHKDHAGWLPTLGWVGATPWRSNDLQQLAFLNDFVTANRLTFHHSGHIDVVRPAVDLLGWDVKYTKQPIKEITEYPSLFTRFDIGLVPLNDIPFNHAKSTIKGLEYTAAGIPFVASWSPEYEWLEQQGIGRVARSEDEWHKHLTDLLDPNVRRSDVERNQEALSAHTINARASEWEQTLIQIKDDER